MPITRRDWVKSVRRGGRLWEIGAWLFVIAIVVGILKGCTGL